MQASAFLGALRSLIRQAGRNLRPSPMVEVQYFPLLNLAATLETRSPFAGLRTAPT